MLSNIIYQGLQKKMVDGNLHLPVPSIKLSLQHLQYCCFGLSLGVLIVPVYLDITLIYALLNWNLLFVFDFIQSDISKHFPKIYYNV